MTLHFQADLPIYQCQIQSDLGGGGGGGGWGVEGSSMRHEEVVTTVRNDLTAALTYLPGTAIRKSFE